MQPFELQYCCSRKMASWNVGTPTAEVPLLLAGAAALLARGPDAAAALGVWRPVAARVCSRTRLLKVCVSTAMRARPPVSGRSRPADSMVDMLQSRTLSAPWHGEATCGTMRVNVWHDFDRGYSV